MDDVQLRCVICREDLENGTETVNIGDKGAAGVNKASEARGNTSILVQSGQTLHVSCHLNYCNKKTIQSALKRKLQDNIPVTRTLRSHEPEFTFSDHCFLCGVRITHDNTDEQVFMVRTWDFQRSIVKACDERTHNDKWAETIRGRIAFAVDLPAVDAVYHQVCSVNFRTGKQIPLRFQYESEGKRAAKVGRRSSISREEAFLQVVHELRDNDDEQTTISDLSERMSEICSDPYSPKYMRQKLSEHLGDDVVITTINGKTNVVTFRTTAVKILQKFYDNHPKINDEDAEKKRIIKTATELIKADIKSLDRSKAFYPDPVKIGSLEANLAYLPNSLRLLLSGLFSGKKTDLKVSTIGQCIVQATRPRVVIAPIPFGLGVQLHHLYGSRFLIDSLSNHGLCSSYQEVLHFSKCAATVIDNTFSISGHFGHYIADNVDHNVRTLDGHGTFHGMGIIVAVTPEVRRRALVPRLALADQCVIADKLAIRYYNKSLGKGTPILFQKQSAIIASDPLSNLDLIWKISWPLRPKRPGWSGLMQAVCTGEHPGKSSIHFLPMIDMDPTDLTCIYSTLLFVVSENRRHSTTPILTFDQPLWFKAKKIVMNEQENSDLRSVILKLGSFHTMMSYLGCIGHLMNSSGLKEVLGLVYADNAVNHILTGKAYARAVRAHTMINAALNAMFVMQAYNVQLLDVEECKTDAIQQKETGELHPDLKEALGIFDALLAREVTVNTACSNSIFRNIHQTLDGLKSKMTNTNTGQLWLQYMTMVDLLLTFLKAERTGNFLLHLNSLQNMLPYLASSGHSHYTRSAHIYIQDMLDLEKNNTHVYEHFLSGHFVIRRSDRFWSGLSTDLVIEQALMRTLKATGGLTHGRGMEESQRTRWLLSMPACAEINECMQDLTGAQYSTSDQHKEMTYSRKVRDCKDTKTVLEFLQDHDPFQEVETLRNIATGVVAESSANPQIAVEVGSAILNKMIGQNALDYTFRKIEQVKVMGQKAVSAGGESIVVDPQLLFQRLLIVAKSNCDCDLNELFKFELSSSPTSLFDEHGLLREANKAQLSDTLSILVNVDQPMPSMNEPMYHVLDGGSLIHRLPWKKDDTYEDICDMHVRYVEKHYPNAIVVFDGYTLGPSTKDVTHLRRSNGTAGPRVSVAAKLPLKSKKEHFLANSHNKQQLIDLLKETLHKNGIKTVSADGDADVLIAKTGVNCSMLGPTHVIGEDTDVLMLLCYYANNESKGLVFRSDRKCAKSRVWNIDLVRRTLGQEFCQMLPVIHAIGGCDTTSRLFGVGKGSVVKKVLNDSFFKSQIEILSQSSLTVADVDNAGEKALVCLFGGKQKETLDQLRLRKFSEKVATSACSVKVQTLPPTTDAAKYHSLRVYYQGQVWVGSQRVLKPTDWGWHLTDQGFEPRKMDLMAAPEFLLKIIRCQCKGDCDSLRCSCRKNGMDCSSACVGCKGTSCSNSSTDSIDVDTTLDESVTT